MDPDTDLDTILATGAVRTVFQPIIDLDTGSTVAYEALSRGPAGGLERPDLMFAAARRTGRLAELDALCRSAALDNAVLAGLREPLALFVNVEPEILDSTSFDDLVGLVDPTATGFDVVLEITERAIAARPAELLATVRRLREAGGRIALDDVGTDDLSLAFMPPLRPDVVKLDLNLVQARPDPAIARIVHAVNAYAEQSGAMILAEGIETEQHLLAARAFGARFGQGWLFGRPTSELDPGRQSAALRFAPRPPTVHERLPFACVPAATDLRVSTKPLLIELSKHLEREALQHGKTCVVLSTFQFARHFTPATAQRYAELAARTGFVAAVGRGMDPQPVPGVRGADIDEFDPLGGEWDIVVLSPHFAAALLARDLGDDGPDAERRFEFVLTYDRETVVAAGEALLSRVLPVAPMVSVSPTQRPRVRRRSAALSRVAATTSGRSA